MMTQKSILLLGCWYVGKSLGCRLLKRCWGVFAITRHKNSQEFLREMGFLPILFSEKHSLETFTHVLSSIPGGEKEDPGLSFLERQGISPSWRGYLSSTAVYGDYQGDWVDEISETKGKTLAGRGRLNSEAAWRDFSKEKGCSLLIYRLSGIYGPYRNVFQRLKDEKDFPKMGESGQFISRIHVDDICNFLMKALSFASEYSIFNGADDCPGSFEEVRSYAFSLSGQKEPLRKGEEATSFRDFLKENKRILNTKMKEFLGKPLTFPSYREGLKDIFEKGLF